MQLILLLLLISCVNFLSAILPSYIIPCSKSATDFRQCLIKNADFALQTLIKGDKKLKIPNFSPLKFPQIVVNNGAITFSLVNLDVYGYDTAKFRDVDINFEEKFIFISVNIKATNLIGNYQADGTILVLPVQGKGPANISTYDGLYSWKMNYDLVNRNEKNYIKLFENATVTWTIKSAHFQFDNLFNGNKQLGDELNKVLNENDQDALKELAGPVIESILKGVIKVAAQPLFDAYSIDEIFLP